ncbi:HupE/UreJ family protein [Aurantivibrio plasticivorans]
MRFTLVYVTSRPLFIVLIFVAFSCAVYSGSSLAHDAPARVELKLFAKQNASTLDVLIRVPTDALREIDFPKRGPGYLDFDQLQSSLDAAVATYFVDEIHLKAGDESLARPQIHATRISLPSDIAFSHYDSAIEHFNAPTLDNQTNLYWNQALLDVWLIYDIPEESERFYFESNLYRLGETTLSVVYFLPREGDEQVFSFVGDVGEIALNPGVLFALLKFTVMGFEHIIFGIDHLLFLLCLVLPVRRYIRLVPLVTAFTLAHSVTLVGAALGVRIDSGWFAPLIEVLIAASIIYVAIENIVGVSLRHRVVLTYVFGLVHGFGFSFLLSERLQFAGEHLISSLVAFNLGVELGQLVALAIVVVVMRCLLHFQGFRRYGVLLLSAFVVHEAWHWLTERFSQLLQYSVTWPSMDWVLLGQFIEWLILVIVGATLFWFMRLWYLKAGWLNDASIEDSP